MFKFRLQKILDYYAGEEMAKKLEVAQAAATARKTHEEINALEVENLKLMEQAKETSGKGFAWLQLSMERVDQNLLSKDRLVLIVAEQLLVLDQKRRELTQVAVRRKALETLKDKRQKAYRLKTNQKNQKQMDEVYQLLQQRVK